MHAIWGDEPLADTRRSLVQFHETTTPGAISITTFYKVIHLAVPAITFKIITHKNIPIHTFLSFLLTAPQPPRWNSENKNRIQQYTKMKI
jgi:hypothetical protein